MLIDERYIQFAGNRLQGFKAKARGRYACRCPICGDSTTDKKKVRGNFFVHTGKWIYHCFNCNVSLTVGTFLKKVFPDLYNEYLFKTVIKKEQPKEPKAEPVIVHKHNLPDDFVMLPKISELSAEHSVVTYLSNRKIPAKYFTDLYYAERFKEFANAVVPGTFSDDSVKYDDARVVIPFRNKEGFIFAFQGRALGASKVKYITVKIDPDAKKLYGLDRVDTTKKVYVVEGPIDSMFIDNCLASADASLSSAINVNWNVTYIWDNEPRSIQIIKKMEEAIKKGESVVVWKKSLNFKDINDAIQNHEFSEADINALIKERTFSGLRATLELNTWRKK